ncbi:Histone-lysine N-methyltransferase, H3 lysine-36 specific, partial [Choanephora cucurbitarum]
MQSADIRLVYVAPSKSLALETDSLDYNTTEEQGHRNTKSITGDYDVDMGSATGLNLTAFDNLTLSQADFDPTYDDDDEDYESFVSQSKEPKEDETDDKSEDEVQLPSATADAMETYENITENIYCGSATGKSIAEESMPCECKYRPEKDSPDAACGDDNHCINRMMFMECMVDDCPCDRYCRNRRFQLRQYARVDVIRTEMKGFGLRALTDLPANAFIMEYIGEVIPNHEFIRRTKQYEAAGLQHYYFMTLKTDEIIDATKKGCLARFINHSCNPNCVTQKWVVGKNMRIGIFTKKAIQAGSELTFDYKFERYGAVAQPCYCGEPTCKGYIGGSLKTNHDSAKPSMVDGLDESGHIHSDDDDDDDDEDSDSDEEESDVMSGNESDPDDNKKGAKHSGRKTMKEGSTGAVTLT